MIAHETPSIAPQKREQQSLRYVLDRSAHKLIFKTSALFLLLLGGKAFFQRGYGSLRRLAAEIKKPRMRTAGVLSASAFAALTESVYLASRADGVTWLRKKGQLSGVESLRR
ncbi:hypothetical protein [Bradyrhizobium sp. I1.7.5]|uniref:hypothetical protein n=1 Tax=Bradyrhizobium sp. I1.7.5 TaxID=3156363 RepID=UPI003393C168